MNINASIIDQRLESVTDAIREQASEELSISDPVKLKSLAFVYLCVKTVLDLEDDNTFDCLTEGGGDFGVDACTSPRNMMVNSLSVYSRLSIRIKIWRVTLTFPKMGLKV